MLVPVLVALACMRARVSSSQEEQVPYPLQWLIFVPADGCVEGRCSQSPWRQMLRGPVRRKASR